MLRFYKPNKNNTGGAVTFSFSSKGDDGAIFAELVKQNGWDEKARGGQGNGIFKGGDKINLKFSFAEVGGIMRALSRNLPSAPKIVHATDKGSKTATFLQWGKDSAGNGDFKGWALSASSKDKDGNQVKASCSFSFDEAIVLLEWFRFALVHVFTGFYSADKKRRKEFHDKRGGLQTQKDDFSEEGDEASQREPVAEKPKSVEDFVGGKSAPQDDDGQF